ncbi:MAG: putative DNA-binding domain-containing protein [Gammaproteobacteria bacterium]|nr:putative DNA-binding domain-containing protein [Gammaproteobacteria bacterium]
MDLPAFKKHQYEFTAHIRDPDKNAKPNDIEDRRMAIYRDLFYNNIEGFIASGFPVIREIYSDENWHKMVRDFFANHQSKSPYFLEISQEFIEYLTNERQVQDEDPAGLIELAHYEWVELALHVSDETIDMNNIDANGDLLSQHPVFSPVAWPLVYQFPVHTMGPDNLPDIAPEQLTYLVVYRNRSDQVRFLEINPVTARLISLLQENESYTGNDAIKHIIEEMKHPNPEVVQRGGLAALEELQQHGIILGTKIS